MAVFFPPMMHVPCTGESGRTVHVGEEWRGVGAHAREQAHDQHCFFMGFGKERDASASQLHVLL